MQIESLAFTVGSSEISGAFAFEAIQKSEPRNRQSDDVCGVAVNGPHASNDVAVLYKSNGEDCADYGCRNIPRLRRTESNV